MKYILSLLICLFITPAIFAEDNGDIFHVTTEKGVFDFQRVHQDGDKSVYVCTKRKSIRQSHGVDIYEYYCNHCDAGFNTRAELHRHVKSYHNNKW
jgi:hypothetical protein